MKRWQTVWLCTAGMLMCALSVRAAEPPAVSSQAAAVYEVQSGRFLYEKAADVRRPMASTTKLMTALIAAEQLNPMATVTVPEAAVHVEGSSLGLRGGDRLTVRDLLTGLLLVSGNDAANAVALTVEDTLPQFADRMNRRATELGMTNSRFVTPSGLDEGGHGSTAHDMALLGAAVLRSPLLSGICRSKTAAVTIGSQRLTVRNHNRLLWMYADCVGLKTGYTTRSGKCLVSAAKRNGVTLVVATLSGGDYWNDHMALYEYGFSRTHTQALSVPTLPTVPVVGSTERVALMVEPPRDAVLTDDETVTCRLAVEPFLWMPITRGQTVGTVEWICGDRILASAPLLSKETVVAPHPSRFSARWLANLLRLITALR